LLYQVKAGKPANIFKFLQVSIPNLLRQKVSFTVKKGKDTTKLYYLYSIVVKIPAALHFRLTG
jgi:hypothetical protein